MATATESVKLSGLDPMSQSQLKASSLLYLVQTTESTEDMTKTKSWSLPVGELGSWVYENKLKDELSTFVLNSTPGEQDINSTFKFNAVPKIPTAYLLDDDAYVVNRAFVQQSLASYQRKPDIIDTNAINVTATGNTLSPDTVPYYFVFSFKNSSGEAPSFWVKINNVVVYQYKSSNSSDQIEIVVSQTVNAGQEVKWSAQAVDVKKYPMV